MNRRSTWIAFCGALMLACGLALPLFASKTEESPAIAESADLAGENDVSIDPEVESTEGEEAVGVTAEATSEETVGEAVLATKKPMPTMPEGGWNVYVVPVEGVINDPQFYILRRALKEAIKNDVDIVLLKMNTPGGSAQTMLEMMDALKKFAGTTITFVDNEAISAGSFISIATDDIWFSPTGVMGAAEVVMANGQDLPESMKNKMQSYLDVKVRSITQDYRYRADVQRAMMDPEYELVIDGEIIKPVGKLLSVTAQEAVATYGTPPEPLLAEGIADDVNALLDKKLGVGNYQLREFEVTWIERFSQFISMFGAVFLGLGIVMLGMEFKTPGFGVPGVFGLFMLGLFFLGKYGAGLSGSEGILFFLIGLILIAVEIFLLPGTLVAGVLGVLMIFGALLWAMADIWPEGSRGYEINMEMFYGPAGQLSLGIAIAFLLGIALLKLLPQSVLQRTIILGGQVGDAPAELVAGGRSIDYPKGGSDKLPGPGARGLAVTDLHPGGQVEIDGRRFQARVILGSIEKGDNVEVVEQRDFSLVVRAV